MPKYKVLERSFINNSLVEAGTIVDYDGVPGPNLEAQDKAAKAAESAAGDADAQSMERMKLAAAGVEDLPDPTPPQV